MSIHDLSQRIHKANAKWWQNIDTSEPLERNQYELLSLVVSEISECLEGERKDLMDDKLPHRKMAEVEMADAYIRLLDYAAGFAVQLHERKTLGGKCRTPKNKGEALFKITARVVQIPNNSLHLSYSLVMIEAYCEVHNYDLWNAIEEKLAFNATREDHTHEARRIAGGKQF